jgi:uncharacterized Zn finger protein
MLRNLVAKRLERMTGSAYYSRGNAYFSDGRVSWFDLAEDDRITARVKGTRNYEVRFWQEDGGLGYDCDCPVGQDGEFCKHCVALGLAWLAEDDQTPAPLTAEKPRKGSSPMTEIREYLGTLESAALIDLLMEACGHDDRFREQLLLKAGSLKGVGAAVKGWKEAFKRATSVRGFVEYDEMPDFIAGIDVVVDALAGWIDSGQAAPVVDLAEQAISRLEAIMGECDDSDGELGGVVGHLAEIHLSACEIARPDPEALAERLFEYETHGDWESFIDAAERYAEVLGESGLAVYRRLAEAAWAKVPAITPGDGARGGGDMRRFSITRIMEALARRSGDIEALVAVKARDLSSAWNFLQIAEIYRQANDSDRALQWAERGVAAFPERTDNRLRDFLIEDYLRRHRGEDALALVWKVFEEDPRLPAYSKLHRVANAVNALAHWRDRALTYLRQDIQQVFLTRSRSGFGMVSSKPDQSRLVEILLWEGEVESAWREAQTGFCQDALWLGLADRLPMSIPRTR